MRSIGIDIGSLSIKVADIELNGRILSLRDYVEMPYGLDTSTDKKIQIIETLRKISAHYAAQSVRFVVSLPQEQISTHYKIFPFRERTKILKSLPFELEDEIPFDQAKSIFDARILRTQSAGSEILSLTTRKQYIEDFLELLKDGGIDPDIITSEGLAISNNISNWWLPPLAMDGQEGETLNLSNYGPVEVFLSMGHSKSIFIAIQDGIPIETRSLPFGGHDAVRAIQKTYEISYPEALKGLQEKGFVLTQNDGASKDQITFSNTIQRAILPLVQEVQKTILNLESKFNISIGEVHLMGGMSHLINIGAYFTQKLGIICNPYNHLSDHLKIYANHTDELQKNSALAIGLAIEGVKKTKSPAINFRKHEFSKSGSSSLHFWKQWKKTIQYASAILILFFVYSFAREQSAIKLEELSSEALRTVARSPSVGIKGPVRTSLIEKHIRDQKKIISDHTQLSNIQEINSPLDIINHISRSLPDKRRLPLDIQDLSIKNELVSIKGELSSQQQVQSLKESLRKLSMDNRIVEQPTGASPAGRVAFHLSFKLDRKSTK